MQRSRLLVTSPASAGLAPSNRLADRGRSAEKMRPFENLLQRRAFLFSVAGATAVVSALLALIARNCFTIHQTGTAVFAGAGSLMTAFFAWRYFKDARAIRRP